MKNEIKETISRGDKLLNPSSFIEDVFEKHGRDGLEMAMFLLRSQNAQLIASPFGPAGQVEWKDIIDFKDLFESEGLNAAYGKFIDQRFIDFLHRNFDEIDRMHWRKFEQLTAEYLERQGFTVNLGPGRGDDGVDVRAWLKNDKSTGPSLIVQCKRQRDPVAKVVVKALYADVLHERATSGLLVTTSRLARGANESRIARAYPIEVADRPTLRAWIESLRRPGAGNFVF